ncbi:MAG: ABC transporter permease [Chthoniobacterales bacterium]
MLTFWTLWKREIATYFHTALGVTLFVLVLLLTGFNFYASVHLLNHGPTGISIVEAFFNNLFFGGMLLVLAPLITMRLFAEEYKTGTIETLMTAPVRDTQVVLAKFLGAFFFFVLLWIPSLLYFILFWPSAHQVAAAGYGAYFGAYGMLLLQGAFYIAVGCMASSLTPHQLISAILSLCLITLFFFGGILLTCIPSAILTVRPFTEFFFPIETMKNFSHGVIDTRSIVFYLSMTLLFLFLTLHIFQSRKWRR